MYNLRGGFLVRPLAITVALGCAGALLSEAEEAFPEFSVWVPKALFSVTRRPSGGTSHSRRHCRFDYDGRLHRVRDLADDPDVGFHAGCGMC